VLSSVWTGAAILAALVALYYGPTVGNDFVWDDRLTAIAPVDISTILSQRTGDYYRPVVMLSFALDRFLWGASPLGYHLVNIACHLLASGLLMALCRTVGLGSGVALAAAIIFACHPVQSDAVLYISGRTDILCAVFVLLSLHAWRRARSATDPFALASGMAVLISLLCKEAAVAAPLVLLLPGAHPSHRPPRPILPIAAAVLWLSAWAATTAHGLRVSGMIERLPAAGVAALSYARLLLWPGDLHLERFVAVSGWSATTTTLTWTLLGLSGVAVTLGARRVVGGSFWLALFLAAYAPVSGLVPIYRAIADRALFMPEHFLYLPLLGLAPLVTALVTASWPRRILRFAPAPLALCVLAWGAVVLDRGRDWRDEETLFRHTIRYNPPAARVWFNLANLRLAAGELDEAEALYRAALLRAPGDAGAHLNLGIVLQRQRRLAEAENHYEAAIRFAPAHSEAYRALAALLLRRGEAGRAHILLEQAHTLPRTVAGDGQTPAEEKPSPR
jgi:hypothetical protein